MQMILGSVQIRVFQTHSAPPSLLRECGRGDSSQQRAPQGRLPGKVWAGWVLNLLLSYLLTGVR